MWFRWYRHETPLERASFRTQPRHLYGEKGEFGAWGGTPDDDSQGLIISKNCHTGKPDKGLSGVYADYQVTP